MAYRTVHRINTPGHQFTSREEYLGFLGISQDLIDQEFALFEKYTAEQKLLSYTITFEGESVIVTRYTDNMQSTRNLQNEMSDLYNNFGLAWKDILQRFNWESQYTFEEATYPPA